MLTKSTVGAWSLVKRLDGRIFRQCSSSQLTHSWCLMQSVGSRINASGTSTDSGINSVRDVSKMLSEVECLSRTNIFQHLSLSLSRLIDISTHSPPATEGASSNELFRWLSRSHSCSAETDRYQMSGCSESLSDWEKYLETITLIRPTNNCNNLKLAIPEMNL